MVLLRSILIYVLLLVFIPVFSQQEQKPPKLVVFLNFDELRTEHLLTFRKEFGKYGFSRFINDGKFFHKASYRNNSTFRGAKITNMLTGCYPNTHGIVGESWYAIHKDKEEHASRFVAAEETHPDSGQIIYPRLSSSTFIDELKLFNNGKSKIASISMSPEVLAYTGKSDKHITFWFDRKNGKMVSREENEPEWAVKFNNMKFADMYVDRQWGPLSDINKYQEYVNHQKKPRHFMYDMKNRSNDGLPYQNLIGSPLGNLLLRDFAASLLIGEELGKDDYTDIFTISLTCQPFVNRPFGVFDAEVEDIILRLNVQIETIIQLVKDNVGLENTLFVISSTPTISWLPERLFENDLSTGVFNGKKTSALLNLYLMAIYGQGKWVKGYHDKQFYFNHKLLEEQKVDVKEIQERSAQFLLEVSGIDKTISAHNIRTNEYTRGDFFNIQRNYFYGRSGDLFISLKPGWVEETNGHGEIKYQQNCSAPLIFFGWNLLPEQILESVKMIDVAPTISKLLQITEPNGCVGEPLKEVLE